MLKSLPASLGQLRALRRLMLARLDGLEDLPDAVVRLTSLGSLIIKGCGKLRALLRGIGKLGALKQLMLHRLKLRTLPASIVHLSWLQKLWFLEVSMEDMPCIETLTALHELQLHVAD